MDDVAEMIAGCFEAAGYDGKVRIDRIDAGAGINCVVPIYLGLRHFHFLLAKTVK